MGTMQLVLMSALCFLGAIAPFTERGTTDFDAILLLLNPYGEWKEVSELKWQFFPFVEKSYIPMTKGQWIYSDFGWCWQGNDPFSWVCDHYGVWKRGKAGTWGWSPDPLWHAMKVDFRVTKTHVGWRPSALTLLSEYVEKEEERFAKPEEWVFVTREKFKHKITPADVVTGAEAAKLLEESEPSIHTFLSWREMDRVGPHPADFVPKERIKPEEERKEGEAEMLCPVIWSLPSYWTPPPKDAKPEDIYLYKPKFYQDLDGIERRILIWQRPNERDKAIQSVNHVLGSDSPDPAPVPNKAAGSATSPTPAAAPVPVINSIPTKPNNQDSSETTDPVSLRSKR